MKYLKYLVLISLLMAWPLSCDQLEGNNEKVCEVDNPLNDLSWLNDIKRSIQLNMSPVGSRIIQYTYQGETVFWVDLCYQCPDGLVVVYNCQGEVICEFGGIDGRNTCMDFDREATDSTMLFHSIQN